jgi:hypothetical protein
MANKRAFVRYTKSGKIVPGSLILTNGSFPSGPSTWKEVPMDLCCDNPLSITYEVDDAAIALVSIRIICNGVIVNTAFSNATSTDDASLENILNNAFGLIGSFSVTGTVVTLTMTATQKNELCPSGTLSFEIFAD